ncbi:MAG: glycosyltransferase family 2 protein [Candidatus Omnitrophica bacterium]|nr:glycosyltransferase family 2 protein [Candidatus Omnitrophota bacterium]
MKCDIIIPVWNERELTARCIETILDNTHSPYRIIIIDNGSDPETAQYLNELAGQKPELIYLKRNDKNLGFPKAVNQGIGLSDAPYLCILNNDTEVHKDWLTEMIQVAEKDAGIGVINPASNNLGQKSPAPELSGKWIEMTACTGFCMLVKREVIDRVGMFDEIYTPGNFEDMDFSKRVVKAGYRCILAKGAYVYHRQNTSFKKRQDWDDRFKRNRNIFNERWGSPKRIVYIITGDDPGIFISEIKEFIKKGDWVWVILRYGLKDMDLPEHTSLSVFRLVKIGFTIRVIWRVLKRKKRFDSVVTDSRFLSWFFKVFGYSTLS